MADTLLELIEKRNDTAYYLALDKLMNRNNRGGKAADANNILKLDGTLAKTPEERMRWIEHFQQLSNEVSAVSENINDYLPRQRDVIHELDDKISVL